MTSENKKNNPIDENAIAIIKTDSVGKETVVGHLPENIAKLCFLFLKVPFTSIKAEVTGKKGSTGEVVMDLRCQLFIIFQGREEAY